MPHGALFVRLALNHHLGSEKNTAEQCWSKRLAPPNFRVMHSRGESMAHETPIEACLGLWMLLVFCVFVHTAHSLAFDCTLGDLVVAKDSSPQRHRATPIQSYPKLFSRVFFPTNCAAVPLQPRPGRWLLLSMLLMFSVLRPTCPCSLARPSTANISACPSAGVTAKWSGRRT